MDIPVQGAKGLELADLEMTASEWKFNLPAPIGARFELQLSPIGGSAVGKMWQHGMAYSVRMSRTTVEEAKSVGPPRPQTPKPPFSYSQRDVTYVNPKDGTKLAGTLTLPEGDGLHPAVILITGSGAQDRDESIMGHKPFLVIADHLTRNGIAVLRVDDRGVGGSSGSVAESTAEDSAGDVSAGITFLESQSEIDPGKIGLVGHSEGGIIAPMVAAGSSDVACIVLLAGPAFPGTRILNMQMEAILRASGNSEDEIKRHSEIHRKLLERLTTEASESSRKEALRELIVSERSMHGMPAADDAVIEKMVDQQMGVLGTPWMTSFLKHDPRDALRKVRCPVLALVGSLDLQVPADANLKELKTALQSGGNTNIAVKKMEGLNHLFQEAKTGTVGEYGTISQTISPKALDEITNWLRTQFKIGH